jgi:hypothetical protein
MIAKALTTLCPGAQWILRGDTYDGLEWLDASQTKPTKAEVVAEIARLEAEHIANQYQRDRAAAYPSIADQLDTLYHGGYDAWKAEIAAVKNQYPKTE